MKKIIKILVVMVMMFSLFGCLRKKREEKKPYEPLDFAHIVLSLNHMENTSYNYEVVNANNEVTVRYYLSRYNYQTEQDEEITVFKKTYDNSLYTQVCKVLGEAFIKDWDGFSGSNPDVCDGTTFSFKLIKEDGSKIVASGTNLYPEGYRTLSKYLVDICSYQIVTTTALDWKGFTFEVPASWINEVKIKYDYDMICFCVQTIKNEEHIFLIIDALENRYYNDTKTIKVGTFTNGETTYYVDVRKYNGLSNYLDKLTDKQQAMAQTYEQDVLTIVKSFRAIDGWKLYLFDDN